MLKSCVFFQFVGILLWTDTVAYICRCKKLSAARKQMSVYRAPNILVIQLKVNFKSVSLNLLLARIMPFAFLLAFLEFGIVQVATSPSSLYFA